jgi:hypothetical protein
MIRVIAAWARRACSRSLLSIGPGVGLAQGPVGHLHLRGRVGHSAAGRDSCAQCHQVRLRGLILPMGQMRSVLEGLGLFQFS